jgi:hypothetical protein
MWEEVAAALHHGQRSSTFPEQRPSVYFVIYVGERVYHASVVWATKGLGTDALVMAAVHYKTKPRYKIAVWEAFRVLGFS